MAVNEHTIELINRSLDGDLSESEQAELESILASSEEARSFRDELSSVARLLENTPPVEPPAHLERNILNRIELPPPRKWFTHAAGWMQGGRPVSHGIAAAIGVLFAIALYEFTPSVDSPQDLADMVGTMSADQRGGDGAAIAGLEIEEAAVGGTIRLVQKGKLLHLEVDIESQTPTEIHAQFKDTGLVFEGFANVSDENVEGFLYSRGNFSVASARKKKFSVILSSTETIESMAGKEIQILISENRGVLYRGSFSL